MRLSLTAAVAAVTFLAVGAAWAQDRLYYDDNRTFVQDGLNEYGQPDWYVLDEVTGKRFRVNPDVISVKLDSSATRAAIEDVHDQMQGTELRVASTGWADVQVVPGTDVFSVIKGYLNSDVILDAEPTFFGEWTFVPNDTQYGQQYALAITGTEDAWDTTTGDASIVVAILDSGTQFTHEDIGPGADGFENVWQNPGEDAWSDPTNPNTGNGVDDDMNGFVDDWKGYNFDLNNNNPSGSFFHGTAVAGVTAAKTNNATGVAGAAGGNNSQGISMMLGNVGQNAPNGSVIDDAILYAAANGAHIVQLSLSVGQTTALDDAIDQAYINDGLLVINAAGNGASQGCPVGYPARHVNAMAISASTSTDSAAGFTCWGPQVELSAPGSNIRTTNNNPADPYTTTGGTSFSAPLVSGIAALVWSQYPSLTNVQMREILWNSAEKVGGFDYNWNPADPGHSIEFGYGRVNSDMALDLAQSFAIDIYNDSFEDPPPPPR